VILYGVRSVQEASNEMSLSRNTGIL
jgi:hypothetical protein